MTMIHSFDTYDAATRMKKAGFEEEKVEVLLTLLKEASRDDHLVTKEYLDHRLIQLEQRMVIKIGGLIVAAGAVLGLISRYLPPIAG